MLLLIITVKVDQIMDTAEHISDVVESVADKVDKVIEDIEDDLPEGTQIRKTLDFIESVAERVEKDAHTAGDFIDKVCLCSIFLKLFRSDFSISAVVFLVIKLRDTLLIPRKTPTIHFFIFFRFSFLDFYKFVYFKRL